MARNVILLLSRPYWEGNAALVAETFWDFFSTNSVREPLWYLFLVSVELSKIYLIYFYVFQISTFYSGVCHLFPNTMVNLLFCEGRILSYDPSQAPL